MSDLEQTRILLTEHCKKYPLLKIQDIFKFLHQSAFGCEHLVSSLDAAKVRIAEEYATLSSHAVQEIEQLDGEYCRVPLSILRSEPDVKLLAKLFYMSAKAEPCGKERLIEKLNVAKQLIEEGALPFDAAEFDHALDEWKAQDFSAMRHSEVFRKAYSPAYRVIANEYISMLKDNIK